MVINEQMDKESSGLLSYWAQGIVYCYDKLSDNQFRSMLPGFDIEKKIEVAIEEHNLKQYQFYQGFWWGWHMLFDAWQFHHGYKVLDVKLKTLERALLIYQYSKKENLIYKDLKGYWKEFGVMCHE